MYSSFFILSTIFKFLRRNALTITDTELNVITVLAIKAAVFVLGQGKTKCLGFGVKGWERRLLLELELSLSVSFFVLKTPCFQCGTRVDRFIGAV